MTGEQSRFIVSPEWVEKRLDQSGLIVIDASWYLPAHNRNNFHEYTMGHLPGAVFFDQDKIADTTTGLPHSLPTPEFFAKEMGALGISDQSTIVVYDGPGFFSAPRVWWMLRIMGAKSVYILDGGLDGWKAGDHPLETKIPMQAPAVFKSSFNQNRVTSFEAMSELVNTNISQIIDARGAGRFEATEPEPRPGMRSGHMPGARNLPATLFSDQGHFKSLSELHEIFNTAGIDLKKPIITSCGSGVTAAIITLALDSLYHDTNSLYDGSWSEWGSRTDTPVRTGP